MDTARNDRDPLGLLGTVIDGRYEVTSFADEGGFGYVYKAQRVMWDRPVALKLFKPVTGDAARQQELERSFVAEGKVLGELSRRTTSIVQSFDIGAWIAPDGARHLYMALEWLSGRTLAAIAEEERGRGAPPWPLERVVRVLTPVAEALSVAHQVGVAHRDVKPGNIFLVDDGAEPTTKLLDFGVAKVVQDAVAFHRTGTDVGSYTPMYGAPEQFSRTFGSSGPWTDTYSLAMVCAELLAGRYPIAYESYGHLVLSVCDGAERPTPRRAGVAVPDAVEAVFERALAIRPEARFQDAGSFWQALLDALPPEAAPRSGPRTTTAPAQAVPARRRRLAVAAGAALAAAAVVAAVVPRTDAPPPPQALDAQISPERLASFAPVRTSIPHPSGPATDSQVELGRLLFFDPRLSGRGDVSCASCHDLLGYGVDGRRTSVGTDDQPGTRNALSVYHAAGAFALNWDGAFATIEEQVRGPLLNGHEMGMTAEQLAQTLGGVPGYVERFGQAYPGAPIDLETVSRALGAFQRKLVTPSRWDQLLEGDADALTADERAGFNTFVDVGCPTCHFGPYVGLTMYQKLGLMKAWPDTADRGRYEVTRQDADLHLFRVPSLRNVTRTGPYLHDGSVASLAEAVRLMARHQLGRELDDRQVRSILAWLGSLEGDIPDDLASRPRLPDHGTAAH